MEENGLSISYFFWCPIHHYNNFTKLFTDSKSKIRNALIQFTKSYKVSSGKNNYYKAQKVFNSLSTDLKELEVLN